MAIFLQSFQKLGGKEFKDEDFFIALEPSIQYFDDLWIDTNHKQRIWKISRLGEVLETLTILGEIEVIPEWFKRYQHSVSL